MPFFEVQGNRYEGHVIENDTDIMLLFFNPCPQTYKHGSPVLKFEEETETRYYLNVYHLLKSSVSNG